MNGETVQRFILQIDNRSTCNSENFFSHRVMKSVSAKALEDKVTPDVNDMALLPGGLIVVADGNNKCVKLMNSQVSEEIL